jgi:hypothetical protein
VTKGQRIFSIVFWIIVAIIIVVVAVGCAAEKGNITDKKYHPAWTEYGSHCIVRDKNGFCLVSSPYTVQHPEEFCFKLDDHFLERCVPHDIWNRYRIGDYYPGTANA